MKFTPLLASTLALVGLLFTTETASAQTEKTAAWTLKVDSPAQGDDFVRALWTDPHGNTYMTGRASTVPQVGMTLMSSVMTVKVDPQGQVVWQKVLPTNGNFETTAQDITSDGQGGIYVLYQYKRMDNTEFLAAVLKYDTDGNTVWQQFLTDSTTEVVDNYNEIRYQGGHLYVAGNTYQNINLPTDMNAAVAKVNAATGALVWKREYDGTMHSDDQYRRLAVDGQGSVWCVGRSLGVITGSFGTIRSGWDVMVSKFTAAGDSVFHYRLNGSGNGDDLALSIALDSAGNGYFSGQIDKLSVGSDEVTVQKLTAAGDSVWNYRFIGSNTGTQLDQPVAVLRNGSVVATTATADGITTFALNAANGAELWKKHYFRTGSGGLNMPYDLVTDDSSNIFIAGRTRTNTDGRLDDVTTLKYDALGNLKWYAYYNEPYTGSMDFGIGLALDAASNVYTIGWLQDSSRNDQFFLAKYGNTPVPTAAAKHSATRLQVYPNPASDRLTIRGEGQNALRSVSLWSVTGHLHRQAIAGNGAFGLVVRDLPPGLYILEVVDREGKTSTQKVSVVR